MPLSLAPRTLTCASSIIPKLGEQNLLEPAHLKGQEGVDQLFTYTVILKTPDDPGLQNTALYQMQALKLNSWIGQEMTLTIQLEGQGSARGGEAGGEINLGAGERQITGLITDARFLREEARQRYYEVTLRPWLALAELRSDCRIFQDMDFVQIIDEVLGKNYRFPVEKRLTQIYPVRDYTTQFNETDYHFFARLCQEWGVSWFFTHSDDKHRLVLVDNLGAWQKNPSAAYQTVAYYRPDHKIDEEYLDYFSCEEHLTSGAVMLRDYDYTRSNADLTVTQSDPRETAQNQFEVYQWHGAGSASAHYVQPKAGPSGATNEPITEGDLMARLRMQALRSPGRRAKASGNLRGMVPGYSFTLEKFPDAAANVSWMILSTELEIEEVQHSSTQTPTGTAASAAPAAPNLAETLTHTLTGHYCVQVALELHPHDEQYRPAFTLSKPRSYGPQVARVVGPEGQSIWTDALGRIKVQFPWHREARGDQNDSCWVRVSSPWAGNQLGGVHLPRCGQEVLIDFLGGCLDLPVCTSRLHNQMNKSPFELPAQSALSGFRSRELGEGSGNAANGRSNHLIMDDSQGEIQAQLASDHATSTLSLGFITRVEDHKGRKDARGEGFELRTDAHGAIRAQEGLLITTEARPRAKNHITDISETTERLSVAHELHQVMAQAAQENKAQDAGKDQSEVVQALAEQNKALQGLAGSTSNPSGGKSKSFPELAAPHLILSSPSGIESTTRGSTHIASEAHTAITSGEHIALTSGKSLLASINNSIRLFAYRSGMKLIAASGDIDIQALKDSLNILAKLNLTQTANKITLTAKEEIIINGAGSYTKWNASGVETGTSGASTTYAAAHSLTGPKSTSATLPAAPKEGKGTLELLHRYANQWGVAGAFKVTDALGKDVPGKLNDKGHLVVPGLAPGAATVVFDRDLRDPVASSSYFGQQPQWPEKEGADSAPETALGSVSNIAHAATSAASSISAAPSGLGGLSGLGQTLGTQLSGLGQSLKDGAAQLTKAVSTGDLNQIASIGGAWVNADTLKTGFDLARSLSKGGAKGLLTSGSALLTQGVGSLLGSTGGASAAGGGATSTLASSPSSRLPGSTGGFV